MQNIHLSCEGSSGPGPSWRVDLWFTGDEHGYRVKQQMDEDPSPTVMKRSKRPLSWRRVIADASNLEDLRFDADQLTELEVAGVPDWQAALIKLAWCQIYQLDDEQFQLLLQLTDAELETLLARLPPLTESEVIVALDDVLQHGHSLHTPAQQILQALASVPAPTITKLDDWIKRVCAWLDEHQPDGPSVAAVDALSDGELETLLVEANAPADPLAAAALLARWTQLDKKPRLEAWHRGISYRDESVFLEWCVRRVGRGAVDALWKRDIVLAGRFIDEFGSLARKRMAELKVAGGGAIGYAVQHSIHHDWMALIAKTLGAPEDESAKA